MGIPTDKIKHIAVCVLVSATASAIESLAGANYCQSLIAGLTAGVAIGVGKEYGDKFSPGNKWDWLDIIADIIGSVIGSTCGALVSLL